jgi:hypothetical protein
MIRTPGRRRSRLAVLGLAVLANASAVTFPLGAQPTVTITFDAPPLTPITGTTTYLSQGYAFGCVDANTGAACSSLGAIPADNAAYTGSAALFNNNIFGITTLARQDGGAFDLLSLRMSPFGFGAGDTRYAGPVVFEGLLAGGATVTQTFITTPPVGAPTTYAFPDAFRGLVSLRYRGEGFGPTATSVGPVVDDVVLRQAAVAVVPEPSPVALTATGLLGLGLVARRRRRAAAARHARRAALAGGAR